MPSRLDRALVRDNDQHQNPRNVFLKYAAARLLRFVGVILFLFLLAIIAILALNHGQRDLTLTYWRATFGWVPGAILVVIAVSGLQTALEWAFMDWTRLQEELIQVKSLSYFNVTEAIRAAIVSRNAK